jgi:putative sterol carrier protein
MLRPEIAAVYEKLNLSAMTSKQEKDIGDIAQMLSKKHSEPHTARPGIGFQIPDQTKEKAEVQKHARLKTCKQMTQSMPHYFQPQMASGFVGTIQINVTGTEKFEGYVSINNSDCMYFEGASLAPDITIISDASVWQDVLTGKSSAQKAFMIGKLKVRGNFVVLTKLEQFFKPMT